MLVGCQRDPAHGGAGRCRYTDRVRLFASLLIAAMVVAPACRAKSAPDVRALVADLESSDADKSGKARLRLIEIGEPAAAVLAERLQSGDPPAKQAAATALWGMGSKGRAAVPALGAALADPERDVRLAAAMALGNMGEDAAPAVPALVQALADTEADVRHWAIKALGSIGPAASDALPALDRATKHDPLRQSAEEAMRRIQGREPVEPVPTP
jgi:HEAT repeat protein